MRTEITRDQAREAALILREECDWRADNADVTAFVRYCTEKPRDVEYRFMGALGFGGKFRNNLNNDGIPYVDCYPEHESPERRAMIEKANARLASVFGATAPETPGAIIRT